MQDARPQLLVGAAKEAGRLAVAEERAEQLASQTHQTVLAERTFSPRRD